MVVACTSLLEKGSPVEGPFQSVGEEAVVLLRHAAQPRLSVVSYGHGAVSTHSLLAVLAAWYGDYSLW